MSLQPYQDLLEEILIDETTLQNRVRELGATISADYAGCEDLVVICILKGGVMFLCDLTRYIDVPHMIDFLAASSYGIGARDTTGTVRIDMDLTTNLADKHVLIVEDIIDSGYTLEFVIRMLNARRPASLKLCTLLNKRSRRRVDLQPDYVGFDIEDRYVFGYGLDVDELYRNLPFIGVAKG